MTLQLIYGACNTLLAADESQQSGDIRLSIQPTHRATMNRLAIHMMPLVRGSPHQARLRRTIHMAPSPDMTIMPAVRKNTGVKPAGTMYKTGALLGSINRMRHGFVVREIDDR